MWPSAKSSWISLLYCVTQYLYIHEKKKWVSFSCKVYISQDNKLCSTNKCRRSVCVSVMLSVTHITEAYFSFYSAASVHWVMHAFIYTQSLYIIPISLRLGLWLGPCSTLFLFVYCHSVIGFLLCLGSLLLCLTQLEPSFSCHTGSDRLECFGA